MKALRIRRGNDTITYPFEELLHFAQGCLLSVSQLLPLLLKALYAYELEEHDQSKQSCLNETHAHLRHQMFLETVDYRDLRRKEMSPVY